MQALGAPQDPHEIHNETLTRDLAHHNVMAALISLAIDPTHDLWNSIGKVAKDTSALADDSVPMNTRVSTLDTSVGQARRALREFRAEI